MPVTFRPAPAVERIAEKLIRNHHTDLTDVEIRYVFRSATAKTNGKAVWGKARKMSGLTAYLAHDPVEAPGGDDDFFVVEISEPVWTILDDAQRTALVDHELCHCTTEIDEKTDELKLKLRPHDLEEFRQIVERHGLWQPDLTEFAVTVAQAEFEFSHSDEATAE